MTQYIVTHECDEEMVCSTQDGHAIFHTFGEANDLLNTLRNSPQCDHTLKVAPIEDVYYKLRDHDKRVGRYLWIEAHGSDRLRKAYDLGYTCEEKYLLERARYEGLAGYDIDFCRTMETKPVGCPSSEAIAEIESKRARPDGHRHYLKVVCITAVQNVREGSHRWHDCPHKEACVASFMGYTFFKFVENVDKTFSEDVVKNTINEWLDARGFEFEINVIDPEGTTKMNRVLKMVEAAKEYLKC